MEATTMVTQFVVTLATDEDLTDEQKRRLGRWVQKAIRERADRHDADIRVGGRVVQTRIELDVENIHVTLMGEPVPVVEKVDGPDGRD